MITRHDLETFQRHHEAPRCMPDRLAHRLGWFITFFCYGLLLLMLCWAWPSKACGDPPAPDPVLRQIYIMVAHFKERPNEKKNAGTSAHGGNRAVSRRAVLRRAVT